MKEMVDAIYPTLVEIRRDFHRHPELGLEEYRTSSKIKSYLKETGIKIDQLIGETGIVGLIEGASDGKTIGLRADIDALPIQEVNKTDYISLNPGKMHACGHDVHTTILLGTAFVLQSLKDEFKGNVKLFSNLLRKQ